MDHEASQDAGPLDEVMKILRTGIGSLSEKAGAHGVDKSGEPASPIQDHCLGSAGLLKPLTSKQRHTIRKMAIDTLAAARTNPDTCSRPPFDIGAGPGVSVPAVKCTVSLTAIEHDGDWMPRDVMTDCLGAWHTGLDVTCITDDILAPRFRRFVNEDFIHEQYRLPGQASTVVQISCLLKLSNGDPVQVDTVAVVVPVDVAPMGRSGVFFGQRGLIDSVRCSFVPAVVPAAEGLGAKEDGWGRIQIETYVGLDGTVHSCRE